MNDASDFRLRADLDVKRVFAHAFDPEPIALVAFKRPFYLRSGSGRIR
jgi:hypothetical protein